MLLGWAFTSKAHADVTFTCKERDQKSWLLVFNTSLAEFEKANRVYVAHKRTCLDNYSRVDWLYRQEFELSKLQSDQEHVVVSLVGGGRIELSRTEGSSEHKWTWRGQMELPAQGVISVEACDLSDPEIGMTARN